MTPTNKCNCDCEPECVPKCCTEENCGGDNCQCKEKKEKTVEFEPDMNITLHQMVTHNEFIQAYSNKTDAEIRKCVVCGETNSSFIDSSNMLDVIFHCHEHWLEKTGKKSPSSINKSLSDEI